MAFEIQTPAEFASGIIADLNARRAEVGGVEADGGLRHGLGHGPALAQMFGYSTAVRSLSQGRASFSMQPAGFRVVPPEELEARGLVWARSRAAPDSAVGGARRSRRSLTRGRGRCYHSRPLRPSRTGPPPGRDVSEPARGGRVRRRANRGGASQSAV